MYHGLNISRRKCISSMNHFGMIQIGSIYHHVSLLHWCKVFLSCQEVMWQIRDKNFFSKIFLKPLTTDCFVELACIMTDMVITHCCWEIWAQGMLIFRFLWDTFFHRSSQHQILCQHWEWLRHFRLELKWAWENQRMRRSLSWYLGFKIFDRRLFHRRILRLVVCSVEHMVESIHCFHIQKMQWWFFGSQENMEGYTLCSCHSCIHTTRSSMFIIGVWLFIPRRQQEL